uniref:RNase H type-1 domain-containing protein n=1 Tax=Pyricularia oryzae (strain P131) TaxID=1143193 RepID=L7J927_PYRO1
MVFPPLIPTPLSPPRYTPGSRKDPTGGKSKREAAKDFQSLIKTKHLVGYGFIVYRKGEITAQGSAALGGPCHVFDAETVGALRGLEAADANPGDTIWVCVDSASVIWGLRGSASLSSQWAYIRFHELVEELKDTGVSVRIRWCPGHEGIEGNEKADRLADEGAKGPADTDPRTQGATVSGIRSELRKAAREASARCWQARKTSDAYDRWQLEYNPTKEPNELGLPRRILGHYLAMRTGHGDFRGYHDRFAHQGAKTQCAWCDNSTAPDHLVHCPNSIARRDAPRAAACAENRRCRGSARPGANRHYYYYYYYYYYYRSSRKILETPPLSLRLSFAQLTLIFVSQWGNLIILAAIHKNEHLCHFVSGPELKNLFDKMIQFLEIISHQSSALEVDRRILVGLRHSLFPAEVTRSEPLPTTSPSAANMSLQTSVTQQPMPISPAHTNPVRRQLGPQPLPPNVHRPFSYFQSYQAQDGVVDTQVPQ